MDVLMYKTINASAGGNSVNSGGLNLSQIIKVSRQGEQKDYLSFLSIGSITGNQWTQNPVNKRIYFSADFPFADDEVIYVMYKVTL